MPGFESLLSAVQVLKGIQRYRGIIAWLTASGILGTAAWRLRHLLNHLENLQPHRLLFNATDAVKSIFFSVTSKHVRNLVITSAILAITLKTALRRIIWLPKPLRQGYLAYFRFFFVAAWLLYYKYRVKERTELCYQRTTWNMAIMERAKFPDFRPVWWGFSGHIQTVLFSLLTSVDNILHPLPLLRREEVTAFDGNKIHLDWMTHPTFETLITEDSPIILVLHGLMGSAEGYYCRNLASLCLRRGWRPVVQIRWRCDFAESRDIDAALQAIQRRHPRAPIIAVGYSAGAHVLLSYLETKQKNTPLVGAVAVSPALDLVKMITNARQSPIASYRYLFDYALRETVRLHCKHDKNLNQDELRPYLSRLNQMGAHLLYDIFLRLMPTYSGKGQPVPSELLPTREDPRIGSPFVHTLGPRSHIPPSTEPPASPKRPEELEKRRSSPDFGSPPSEEGSSPEEPTSVASPLKPTSTRSTGPFVGGLDIGHLLEVEKLVELPTDRETPLPMSDYSPHGLQTYDHYARTAGNNLHKIRIPTFILYAEDDPIMPASFVSTLKTAARNNRHIMLALTRRGGHMGWHQGHFPSGVTWAEESMVEWMGSLLSAHANTAFLLELMRRANSMTAPTAANSSGGRGGRGRRVAKGGAEAARFSPFASPHGGGRPTAMPGVQLAYGGDSPMAGPGTAHHHAQPVRHTRATLHTPLDSSQAHPYSPREASIAEDGWGFHGYEDEDVDATEIAGDEGRGSYTEPLNEFTPGIVSRICSASDLTYPNLTGTNDPNYIFH